MLAQNKINHKMDGYNLGTKDYEKVVESFDWINFVKQPSVIVRIINVLMSIIVFGCISSQGWHFDEVTGRTVCIINQSYYTCTYANGIAILAFILTLCLLFGDYSVDQMCPIKMRRQYVMIDYSLSGFWTFLFFISFCDLAKQWHQSNEPAGWYGHGNVAAAQFFTFLSMVSWGTSTFLSWRRHQAMPNASKETAEGYQSFA